MGRKTWDSLGRPLPGRANIVVSRNPDFAPEGAIVVASLEAAARACGDVAEAFVIGGAQIYAQALPLARRVLATEVHARSRAMPSSHCCRPSNGRKRRASGSRPRTATNTTS